MKMYILHTENKYNFLIVSAHNIRQ
uniref:Uncharacterized protein n=1 Tax=Anguilla anguilla TaxID=7936 RepID=A0A0E9RFS3_ANGAN